MNPPPTLFINTIEWSTGQLTNGQACPGLEWPLGSFVLSTGLGNEIELFSKMTEKLDMSLKANIDINMSTQGLLSY